MTCFLYIYNSVSLSMYRIYIILNLKSYSCIEGMMYFSFSSACTLYHFDLSARTEFQSDSMMIVRVFSLSSTMRWNVRTWQYLIGPYQWRRGLVEHSELEVT